MRVLVTGGIGFIGSRVCEKLLRAGHVVGLYDAFISHFPTDSATNPWLIRMDRIRRAATGSAEAVTLYRGDTRNATEVFRAVQEFAPDAVLHLAAVSGAVPAARHAMEAMTCAVDGTATLLEALRGRELQRFVYVSSSMVYGDWPDKGKVSEEYRTKPMDIYGAAKLAGEETTKGYAAQFQIPYVVVRPSAVYGPNDNNHRVVQVFVERAKAGKELVLAGGEEVKLDFTYIDDIADGLILALCHKDAAFGTFNMTYGKARSLGELVGALRGSYPDLRLKQAPIRPNTPMRGALDCSLARNMLDFHPRFGLEKKLEAYLKQEGK